jgi:hypothetical protein
MCNVTEAEWLSCSDPAAMLDRRRRVLTLSPRKARLYACACCCRVWRCLDEAGRAAVAVAEWYADGRATDGELELAAQSATGPAKSAAALQLGRSGDTAARAAAAAAGHDAYGRVSAAYAGRRKPDLGPVAAALGISVWAAGDPRDAYLWVEGRERAEQANILRDIAGNPFRPFAFDPTWRTSAAVGLARTIYAENQFEALPILADALQDAGCEDAEVLTHCRMPGHQRGCWLVDLVLGRA